MLWLSVLAFAVLTTACGGAPAPKLEDGQSSSDDEAPAAKPPPASLKINADANATNDLDVTLNISADGYNEMYITPDPTCADLGTWETRSANKDWTLLFPNSTNAVSAKFRVTATGVESPCVRDLIRHDDVAPTMTVDSPADGLLVTLSNQSAITLSGSCSELGAVVISGAVTMEFNCGLVPWSKTVDLTSQAEGPVVINFQTRDNAGNLSATTTRTLEKDLTAPLAPSLQINAGATYTASTSATLNLGASGADEMKISEGALCADGTWEPYAATKAQTLANSNALNTYSVMYRDEAGNQSACVSASITHDAIAPSVTIASPSESAWVNAATAAAVSLSGACSEEGLIVAITGSVTDSAACTAGAWSKSINVSSLADGALSITARQTDASGLQGSATVNLQKDVAVPAVVTITSPSSNPYTSTTNISLGGGCENGATVLLSGAQSQSVACAASSYSFSLSQGTDGTFNYTVRQQDPAGNLSSGTAFQWLKSSTVVNPPVITSPASSPHSSNLATITLSGSCEDGKDVQLGGDVSAPEVTSPASSLTVACAGSAFSFTIQKTTDGTFSFNLRQWQGAAFSNPVTMSWIRDTTAPTTTMTATPLAINVYPTATFSFTSNDAEATFECSEDGGGYAPCVSPLVLSAMANTGKTMHVRAVDPFGNADATPASFSWAQTSYGTVALYPFSSSSELDDISLHEPTMKSHLTNNGSTNNGTGRFGEGQDFAEASSQTAETAHVETHHTLREQMTVDLWVRFTTLPTATGTHVVLVNKDGGSGLRGWRVSLYRNATNYQIAFTGSVDGVTMTQTLSTANTYSTGTWYHLAVTWDRGTVKFYRSGTARGTATIGTAGSATLHPTTAPVRLGGAADMTSSVYLDGRLDDVRLSRVVRWGAAFTAPASAAVAD